MENLVYFEKTRSVTDPLRVALLREKRREKSEKKREKSRT